LSFGNLIANRNVDGVLTVNIKFMWQGLETGERQAIPEKLYLGQKQYITKLYPVNVILEMNWVNMHII
jgi:hypothetical protein